MATPTSPGSESMKSKMLAVRDVGSLVKEVEEPAIPADIAGGEEGHLKRSVSGSQLTALGVGAIIGTGIFVVIGEGAGVAGPAVILAFVLAAVACIFSALSYAELASSIPVSGSAYTYAYATLGEAGRLDHRLGPDPRVRRLGRRRRGRLGRQLQRVPRRDLRRRAADGDRHLAGERRRLQPAGRRHRPGDHVRCWSSASARARGSTSSWSASSWSCSCSSSWSRSRTSAANLTPFAPHGNGRRGQRRGDHLLRVHRVRRHLDRQRGGEAIRRRTCRSRSSARC